jgi:NitT/TauT family transport system substrate-binding protein
LPNVIDRRRFLGLGAGAVASSALPARAASPLRVGLQDGGTAAWEIAALAALGLPQKYGFVLEIRPLADSAAGQVALKSRAVDVILSDFVWVSVERYLGTDTTLVPFSLAVGGLLANTRGPYDLAGLQGTSIGVGGGPLDKSWLFLQAAYREATSRDLRSDAEIRYGAPPLVNELLLRGQLSSALNFWQWNARAALRGARPVISVAQMLAQLGIAAPPPLLGWTFSETAANADRDLYRAFFAASAETKQHLLHDDDLWSRILRPLMDASDNALFAALRDGYRQGVPSATGDPATLAGPAYALLARYGGADLVQGATTLSPGTFWGGGP